MLRTATQRRRGRTWRYQHDVTQLADEPQVTTPTQLADGVGQGLIRLALLERHLGNAMLQLEHLLSRTEPYLDEKRPDDDQQYPTAELAQLDRDLLALYDRIDRATRDTHILRRELRETQP